MVAYERQISEDEFQISKLKEEIALHNEQAVRFSKQCSINKDNINRWARVSGVLQWNFIIPMCAVTAGFLCNWSWHQYKWSFLGGH